MIIEEENDGIADLSHKTKIQVEIKGKYYFL